MLTECARYEYIAKNGMSTLRIVDPSGFMKGVSLEYTFDWTRKMPTESVVISPNSRISWVMTGPDPLWGGDSDLMRSELWVRKDKGRPQLYARYVLDSVKPLLSAPRLLPPSDVLVLDEASAEIVYEGRPRFSKALAEEFVDAANASREYKATELASDAECGPLCVYFLERLLGADSKYEVPSDGGALESMAQLTALAENHGLEVSALHFGANQELPTGPWIAHIAPSHFVVVSGKRGHRLTVLDPAGGVSIIEEQTFREAWTGYAICPK